MSDPKYRVMLGFSTYRYVESKTVESIVGMVHTLMRYHPDVWLSFSWRDGFPVAGCAHCYQEVRGHDESFEDARNHFAKKALDENATHLFMMDSDMGVPDHDQIYKLLQHEKDIVAPLFIRRTPPYDLLAMRYLKETNAWTSITSAEAKSGKLIEVDGVGFGGILIRTEVLRQMGYPWFAFEFFKNRIVPEDLNFCRKARRDGYKIYVDTSQQMIHYGSHAFRVSEGIMIQEEREESGFRPIDDSPSGDLESEAGES